MAVRTNEELMNAIRGILGEAPDDAGLAIMQDMTDTLAARGDTEAAVKERDTYWRKQIADRFCGANPAGNQGNNQPEPEPESNRYEDLFTEKNS